MCRCFDDEGAENDGVSRCWKGERDSWKLLRENARLPCNTIADNIEAVLPRDPVMAAKGTGRECVTVTHEIFSLRSRTSRG